MTAARQIIAEARGSRRSGDVLSVLAEAPPSLRWAIVLRPEERNLDVLPDRWCPEHGCPTCGAAYAELDAVAVTAPAFVHVHERFHASPLVPVSIEQIRLVCTEGHESEHSRRASWTDSVSAGLALGLLGFLSMVAEARS